MGSLSQMLDFFDKNIDNLNEIIKKLDKVQNVFNSNFSNVNMVRNKEIDFLQKEFFKSPENFPDKIKTSLAISSASQSCPGDLMFRVVISPLWMSSSRALLMRDSISAFMSGLFGIVFFRLKWYINFN